LEKIISKLSDIKTVTEIGPNAGMNLEGIYDANPRLSIVGIEPNEYALKKATEISKGRYALKSGNVFKLSNESKTDLVLICTVLIHIDPNNLIKALDNIYQCSNKYILIMEYYWPTIKEVNYRGLSEALWKQDFGRLMNDNFNVELLETGHLDERDGYDGVTWWLFNKK